MLGVASTATVWQLLIISRRLVVGWLAVRMCAMRRVVRMTAGTNVNVRPGVVFPLLFRRAIAMRMRNHRQLAGDESEQHEDGNTATEHTDSSTSTHSKGYATSEPETMTRRAEELSDFAAFADYPLICVGSLQVGSSAKIRLRKTDGSQTGINQRHRAERGWLATAMKTDTRPFRRQYKQVQTPPGLPEAISTAGKAVQIRGDEET